MKDNIFSLTLLLVFQLGVMPQNAHSETISDQLPNGISVSAEYRQGNSDKPAILVLHGFLTTHRFTTVQVIINELSNGGYTILAPTLSLGINSRNTSLPCDAIHTHTMESDLAEIDFWVNWLSHKGTRKIILIGHSSGSLQLVVYTSNQPHPAVVKVIATSLINIPQYIEPETMAKDIAEANQLAKLQPPPLKPYNMVYCSDYLANPQSYLSYIRWTPEAVLNALRKRQVPVFAIMGGSDNRFGEDWFTALRTTGIDVKTIPGANHFFDATHEFELIDEVKNCIAAKAEFPQMRAEPKR